jgi:ankyrin repeat protein
MRQNPRELPVPSVTTAILYKLPDVVKKLVPITKNINLRGLSCPPAIVEAVYHGDKEIIDTLLAAKPDLKIRDIDANTILHAAACRGHISLISKLIDLCRENLNPRNANGNTPLHDAVGFGHAEAVSLPLHAGADICISNDEGKGQSPLYMASRRRRTQIYKMMLKAHIAQDKLRFQGNYGITPLHIAAVHGLEARVEDIVNQCPDVIDRINHLGKSALHDAVERNRTGVVRILIQHGATIDLKDNEGRTALSWAAHKDNIEIANFLLDNGADPSVPTWE